MASIIICIFMIFKNNLFNLTVDVLDENSVCNYKHIKYWFKWMPITFMEVL